MKKMIILVVLLFLVLAAFAEENTYQYGVGFGGGMISGSGFSFRRLNENGGYQINFGILKRSYNDDDWEFGESHESQYYEGDNGTTYTDYYLDENLNLNIGVNGYRTLHKGQKTKLYFLGGGAIYVDKETRHEQDFLLNEVDDIWETNGDEREKIVTENSFNVGVGIGFDYHITKSISLAIEWPLVVSFTDDATNIYMYIPQGGIHYYFR